MRLTLPLTVEEWLAKRRVVEERRALIAKLLEERGARPARYEPPCPLRVMRPEEVNQPPRSLLDHRSIQAHVFIATAPVDPRRARKIGRDE